MCLSPLTSFSNKGGNCMSKKKICCALLGAFLLVFGNVSTNQIPVNRQNSLIVKAVTEKNSGKCGENLTWTLENGTLTISGAGEMENYNATYNYNTYTPWYYDGVIENVRSVVIEEGVTSIGTYAFQGCENLVSVTIPDTVTSVGEGAFEGCNGITDITIPESVTSMGDYAFCRCKNLVSIQLSNQLNRIGEYTFANCTSLRSIVIPDNIKEIYNQAFYCCASLEEIVFPEEVEKISYCVFDGTPWLEQKEKENPFVIAGKCLIKLSDVSGDIVIPDGITSIAGTAVHCPEATSIVIPDGVKTIGSNAFSNNENLKSVQIPDSVSEIGMSAFCNCKNLVEIDLPKNLITIGERAFAECENLPEITIPESTATVFFDTFSNCTNLKSINVSENNLNYCSVDGVLFTKNMEHLVEYACGKDVENYTVPDDVKVVDFWSFLGSSHLKEVTLPESVIELKPQAFQNCSSMKSLKILNPECKIQKSWLLFDDNMNVTIYGYPDSTAQEYADYRGIPFIALGSEPTETTGDCNNDGKFSVTDVILLQKWLLKKDGVQLSNWRAVDFYQDGKLNVIDLALMKKALTDS